MKDSNMLKRKLLVSSLLMVYLIFGTAVLCAQFAGGSGTEDDPWLVSRPEDVDQIRNYLGEVHTNKYYLQTNDINLRVPPWDEGEGWPPIGTSIDRFYGQYDGGGFVIDSLYINRPDEMRQGLFGDIQDASISNLGVTNADVTGQQYSGPLLGYGRGNSTIFQCWSSGEMTGFNTSTGGLIGYIFRGITVDRCYSTTDVTGNNYVGGLIGMGFRNHTVRDSYATGNVTGNWRVGGFIGLLSQDDSTVENVYSFGRVEGESDYGGLFGENAGSPVTNSYWNIETSQQEQSDGGTGKTTEQMIYPYSDGLDDVYVRWDFDEIWGHDVNRNINDGYPFLQFQADLIVPDSPVVNIEKIVIGDTDHIRLSWELVEDALSYFIYTSLDPYAEDWGEPAAIVGENINSYQTPVNDDILQFYRVTASTQEAP